MFNYGDLYGDASVHLLLELGPVYPQLLLLRVVPEDVPEMICDMYRPLDGRNTESGRNLSCVGLEVRLDVLLD